MKLRDAAALEEQPGVLAQDPRGGGPRRRRRSAAPSSATRRWPSARTCTSCASTGTWAAPGAHEVTKARHRRRGLEVDGHPHHRGQGRGVGEAPAHGGGAAQAHRLPGERDQRGGARHPPHAGRASRTRTGPVGSFLFLGPTGVGKTEVARSLAAFLFGSERALDPLRHVRVHGEALGQQAHRLAPRLRRATRRAASSPSA